MSYVSKIQIGSNESLVGSTLYGICSTSAGTPAKTVGTSDNNSGKFINNHYDNLIQGTTIHVKFTQGNTATNNTTLAVGTQTAKQVDGRFTCEANTIISFTLDENEHWVVNDNVDTNTEYVFKTTYNASTNKALTESDISTAATKDVDSSIIESGNGANTNSTNLPTTAAVVSYVNNKTSGLTGLTGAMHFRGAVSAIPPASGTYESGDVVLLTNSNKEYVYDGTSWILLGDEGSYALKSSTDTITEVSNFTANTLPQLTVTSVNIPNVENVGSVPSLTITPTSIPNVTDAGSATTASVTAGVLSITVGAAPTLGNNMSVGSASDWNAGAAPTLGTAISVGSASGWNAGSQATLTTNDTTVVVPTSSTT